MFFKIKHIFGEIRLDFQTLFQFPLNIRTFLINLFILFSRLS